jgi:hypothetical protein
MLICKFVWAKTQYQRKDDFTAEVLIDAGIWAEFGKIVCISVGYFVIKGDVRNFRVLSLAKSLNFSKILITYLLIILAVLNMYCADIMLRNDIPFLARRMIINQIQFQTNWIYSKKPWEIPHLDTLELWKFGDYKHYTF